MYIYIWIYIYMYIYMYIHIFINKRYICISRLVLQMRRRMEINKVDSDIVIGSVTKCRTSFNLETYIQRKTCIKKLR